MKVIRQSVIPVGSFDTPLLKIEHCARVCYRSHDKSKAGSDVKLFSHLYRKGHWSVFEHVVVEYKMSKLYSAYDVDELIPSYARDLELLLTTHPHYGKYVDVYPEREFSIVCNLRTLLEAHRDLPTNKLLSMTLFKLVGKEAWAIIKKDGEPDRYDILSDSLVSEFEDSLSVEIVTNRAIANEMVRHRILSPSQESTRYVNFNNKEMCFILPYELTPESLGYDMWLDSMASIESVYKKLITEYKWPPQKARGVLPLDLATTIVFTGTRKQWNDALPKRLAEGVHPQAVQLAEVISSILGKPANEVNVDLKVEDCGLGVNVI